MNPQTKEAIELTDKSKFLKFIYADDTKFIKALQFDPNTQEVRAGHDYYIQYLKPDIDLQIEFQLGPVKDVGINGIQTEDLLLILIDRLQELNQNEFACRENSIAITKLEEALMWLNKRTSDRELREVEGINSK